MDTTRRRFLGALAAVVALPLVPTVAGAPRRPPRLSMCDWNLGRPADPSFIPRAAEAGLEGLQVSVGTEPSDLPLREARVRRRYLDLGRRHHIALHSVAAGDLLNRFPLKSEPQAALFVVEAIEAAAALGAQNVLVAAFGAADLRALDAEGRPVVVPGAPTRTYALDERGVDRVAAALRRLAPRAEDAGVVLGLENTLTAEQNMQLIDRAGGSPFLQVYYDVGNAAAYGYDAPAEIRRLGRRRLCEIHLKDNRRPRFDTGTGEVDFEAAARACADIGYDRWYVLETGGRENHFLEDTRANVAYARRVFG